MLLVGGFVGYRAGAFGWLLGAPRETHIGGSKSKRLYIPDAPTQPTSFNIDAQVDRIDPALLGGSKSISISPLVPVEPVKPAKPSK